MRIRALATELPRDYKNVHTNVQRLKEIGLVERVDDEKVDVPWDAVEAGLQPAA